MSKNIKEIGKELLGKSLNSFHRKTGLTQLDKNNEMQDGILNGILSQVDDAYIEKTEQSNVIHLDGSGDGVVVLDSIEGNTMINLLKDLRAGGAWVDNENKFSLNIPTGSGQPMILGNLNYELKKDTVYTVILNVVDYTTGIPHICFMNKENNRLASTTEATTSSIGLKKFKLTTKSDVDSSILRILPRNGIDNTYSIGKDILILEGDWTNKEIPASYIEGLQSSFEEKVNSEGKYEIEILSNNKNLYNVKDVNIGSWMNSGGATVSKVNDNIVLNGTISDYFDFRTVQNSWNPNLAKLINKLPAGTTLTMSNNLTSEKNTINYWSVIRDGAIKYFTNTLTIQKGDTGIGGFVRFQNGTVLNNTILKVQIEVNNKATSYTISKQNKIKLLLNEPLRAIGDVKDRLCINNGKLVVERYCDVREYQEGDLDLENVLTDMTNTIYLLDEIFYEEVTNEYGEPIILEGYENGTLYIDSVIVPTTTVKYTPKMASFKTLKEVNNNNIMLTNDVNDNIIPYMMDVDLMIMEKEMALMSHKNIRKMEVLDMTSMQKRTQDMLERLIKGKTLTEQECKTRVTTYLNAGKITDAQAEELMLLISEVYA